MNKQRHSLNEFQKNRLVNVIDVYYERHVHKKFLADVYAVIPKGRKCVMWFTGNQCWLFQVAKRPHHPLSNEETVSFDDVRIMPVKCMDDAWYSGEGTILYGTFASDKKWFSVENVYYLCGAKLCDASGSMDHLMAFFDFYAKQKQHCEMEFRFFMPIMHTSFGAALKDAMQITSYDVFCIQHRVLNRPCTEYKNLLIHLAVEHEPQQIQANQKIRIYDPTPKLHQHQYQYQHQQPFFPMQSHKGPQIQSPSRTFIVRPDVQNDIYYVLNNADELVTDKTMIAHIPNYKTSVMMNSIFRNIKENRNLDALEESDDEEEPNKDDARRHVDLNKFVRMTCTFNHRFKRWQPCARA